MPAVREPRSRWGEGGEEGPGAGEGWRRGGGMVLVRTALAVLPGRLSFVMKGKRGEIDRRSEGDCR